MTVNEGVSGGNIWNPSLSLFPSPFWKKVFDISRFAVIMSFLIMFILVFTLPSGGNIEQETSSFKSYTPFNEGWEIPAFISLVAILGISVFLYTLAPVIHVSRTKAFVKAILITALCVLSSTVFIDGSVRGSVNSSNTTALTTWLQGEQKLNPVNLGLSLSTLTNEKGTIMYSDDGKLYAVTLKDNAGEITVENKVNLTGKPELVKELK